MKSPPPAESRAPETLQGPHNPPPAKAQSESEKDSGYSDSSSESVSSEETAARAAQGSSSLQPAPTPIYILQSVILKQPRLLLLQPPLRRHRKRSPSYLPILRSYPRIAPRLAPPPAPSHAPSPAPPPGPLLEVSLHALALLRRSRETQRSVRELSAHVRLYERAVCGERGGWERLQSAMEGSGGYRRTPPSAMTSETAVMSPENNTAHSENIA